MRIGAQWEVAFCLFPYYIPGLMEKGSEAAQLYFMLFCPLTERVRTAPDAKSALGMCAYSLFVSRGVISLVRLQKLRREHKRVEMHVHGMLIT